jgi:hypothetical protein
LNFKPHIVHNCYDQSRILAWVEPFRFAPVSKAQFLEIWDEAAKQLGQTRPKKCRCSYRVSAEDAKTLVEKSIAAWIVVDWRYNEEKKYFIPVEGSNLVWGGKQAEGLGLVRSSLAQKTPRVQTIEKAHIERSYVNQYPEDAERIEIWGEMQRKVWADITNSEWDGVDPFKGRSVLQLNSTDQRSAKGIDILKET